MMFLNTNNDIAFFKNSTTKNTKNKDLSNGNYSKPLNNLLRDKWVKDAYKISKISSTTELQVISSSHSTKKANKIQLHKEPIQKHSTNNKRANLENLAQDPNEPILPLSIRNQNVTKIHGPATVLYNTLPNPSSSPILEKLNGKNSATVSNINYYLPLTDNFSNRMSAIVKQTMKKTGKQSATQKGTQRGKQPSIEDAASIHQEPCIDPPTPKRNGEWTEVINPSKEKYHDPNKPRENHFPSKFPVQSFHQPPAKEPIDSFTSGINIKIKMNVNMQIENEDLLQALLDCFHLKDPWVRITPKKQSSIDNPFELWDKDQIQITGTSIGDYIESPLRKINKNEFSARIWMVTSIPLYQITQDDTVQQWLQSERVYLEKTNFEKVNLVNVGFLTKVNPRAESMSLSDLRFKALMGADTAQFHLIKSTIFPATHSHKSGQTNKSTQDIKAKVIMVRAASNDAHEIAEAMASLAPEQTTFYLWVEYQSLVKIRNEQ